MEITTLAQFDARFQTEECAYAYFTKLRWPKVITCPHCGNTEKLRCLNHYRYTRYYCGKRNGGCGGKFSVRTGTWMENDNKVLLLTVLKATWLLTHYSTPVCIKQFAQDLDISEYNALRLYREITNAKSDDIT